MSFARGDSGSSLSSSRRSEALLQANIGAVLRRGGDRLLLRYAIGTSKYEKHHSHPCALSTTYSMQAKNATDMRIKQRLLVHMFHIRIYQW